MRNYTRTANKEAFYAEKVREQNGCCAICCRNESLVVNYNLKTGIMRGVICEAHDKALALFDDSPIMLEDAAAYIRENKPKQNFSSDIDEAIQELLADYSYPSDSARARVLASAIGCSFAAAQTRIHRAQKARREACI